LLVGLLFAAGVIIVGARWMFVVLQFAEGFIMLCCSFFAEGLIIVC
jgi:hypothetical protein